MLAVYPGDTPATALDFGPLGDAPVVAAEQVGTADGLDVFRFTVPAVRNVTATLTPSNSSDVWPELIRDANRANWEGPVLKFVLLFFIAQQFSGDLSA